MKTIKNLIRYIYYSLVQFKIWLSLDRKSKDKLKEILNRSKKYGIPPPLWIHLDYQQLAKDMFKVQPLSKKEKMIRYAK